MDRKHRLTGSSDFQRVRSSGTSYAHPFVVLVACPNDMPLTRFGVTAGRQLGTAVRRNRAKRRLRAALDALQPRILPGWDAVWIARSGVATATWPEVVRAVTTLGRRAGLLTVSP
jgi:ribonuclease P protein component